MAEYLYPGVYVEEFDSGIKAMEGVSTSAAGFIGMAERGPTKGAPLLITSMGEFQRYFGEYLPEAEYGENRFLPYAVESFFTNGGSRCYIMRLKPDDSNAKAASIDLELNSSGKIKFTASNHGKWGNSVKVIITLTESGKEKITAVDGTKVTVGNASGFCAGDLVKVTLEEKEPEYILISAINSNDIVAGTELNLAEGKTIEPKELIAKNFVQICTLKVQITYDDVTEVYEAVSLNKASSAFIETVLKKSILARAETVDSADIKLECKSLADQLVITEGVSKSLQLENGADGAVKSPITAAILTGGSDQPGERIGLNAFKEIDNVSIMAIPGNQSDAVLAELIAHCENMQSRFAILDTDSKKAQASDLTVYKDNFDSTYAAIYHPWLQVYSPVERKSIYIPPSGAVAGVYARTDNSRGVWKAPANEVVRGVTGLQYNYSNAEQGELNPKGINLIRSFPGHGIRVWGARTLSSDGIWKYVNVRRLFIYIEESIKRNTGWAVFEPNDANLWSRVQGTAKVFLNAMWRSGALAGNSEEEAYFVRIGKGDSMTDDDILNGRLICIIGVAPVRPAEFIIFRITQKMQEPEQL